MAWLSRDPPSAIAEAGGIIKPSGKLTDIPGGSTQRVIERHTCRKIRKGKIAKNPHGQEDVVRDWTFRNSPGSLRPRGCS
jgi:hypothetical protein